MPPSPQRTNYTTTSTFTMHRSKNNIVTFTLDFDPARPYATRLTLPPRSSWTPDPHWHERYTEYVQCVAGRLLIRLDGVEKVVTPADGPQTVEKGVVHEFMRADVHGYKGVDGEGEEEDVVVEEWTEPGDGLKQVFFRNVLGLLEDKEYWGGWFWVQALLVCSRYDNYNVLWPGWGKGWVTHGLYKVVEGVAWLAGLKAWYDEYTPAHLREVAEGAQKKSI